MATLAALDIAEDPEIWEELGFTAVDGTVWVDDVAHRLGAAGARIAGWSLFGVDLPVGPATIDGLPTTIVEDVTTERAEHANGVVGLDHLVVATPDHDRTVAALEAVGMRVLGRRESATYGAPMRQAFIRLGPVILEVVGGAEPSGDGPAGFFGLAWTCADLDRTAAWFGPRLHPAKDAVQDGRRIATLDRAAGTRVAMAFMSPEPAR
ncbi:MAG: glyoxalase [Acidimicrobiales bacterium]